MPKRLIVLFLLFGCDDGAGTDSDDPFCADAPEPTMTWENYGEAFFSRHCDGCHTSSLVERYGAPEDINFDDAAEMWTFAEDILQVVVEDQTEPPEGGVSEDERTALEQYLRCSDSGT